MCLIYYSKAAYSVRYVIYDPVPLVSVHFISLICHATVRHRYLTKKTFYHDEISFCSPQPFIVHIKLCDNCRVRPVGLDQIHCNILIMISFSKNDKLVERRKQYRRREHQVYYNN